MLKKLELKFREFFPKHLKNKRIYQETLKGLEGIEIGGPSPAFGPKGLLPVYQSLSTLDGCNFSNDTVWEGKLTAGKTYRFADGKPAGTQFIAEGNDLAQVADNAYDVVLSCHNLEHFANPLKALYEWKRITKPGGYLLLVVPNKEKTFDHLRPVTTLSHIIQDHEVNMPETDDTHFEESILLHDLELGPSVGGREALRERTMKNIENRCVHHHVFDQKFTLEIMAYTNYEVMATDLSQVNIFVLAKNIK